MALSMLPPEPDRATDDYIIEREDQRAGMPVAAQIVSGLRLVMVAILAIASVALFWVVGVMIGLF
jgi:multidrug efflux pump subunit AcrA (membrane-fusion protein)